MYHHNSISQVNHPFLGSFFCFVCFSFLKKDLNTQETVFTMDRFKAGTYRPKSLVSIHAHLFTRRIQHLPTFSRIKKNRIPEFQIGLREAAHLVWTVCTTRPVHCNACERERSDRVAAPLYVPL